MKKVLVGKVVSTHGIKGEIKILSDFQFKDKVFNVGKKLIIDDELFEIKSYRHHKNFEMVTLNEYRDINEVLFLMKKKVYVAEEDLEFNNDEVLDEALVNYSIVTTDGKTGVIKEVFLASPTNKIIRAEFDKEILIPCQSPLIKKIDKEKQEVVVELINGM